MEAKNTIPIPACRPSHREKRLFRDKSRGFGKALVDNQPSKTARTLGFCVGQFKQRRSCVKIYGGAERLPSASISAAVFLRFFKAQQPVGVNIDVPPPYSSISEFSG
jgi:hypothetical protein